MKKLIFLLIILLYGGLFIFKSMNKDKDKLYDEIVKYKLENDTLAINATYDLIYKKIPSSNGYVINVEKSHENMKDNNIFDPELLVYDIIYPEIGNSQVKGPIYQGNQRNKTVSININVAWGEEYLLDMLEILDQYEVKVNFFVEGNWAKKNSDLMTLMVEKGHLIGNHSMSHKDFSKMSYEEMKEDILATNEIIKQYTNKDVIYFAPPSGAYNEVTLKVCEELNMELIMWSVDTIDWQKPSVEVIKNRVYKKLDCGSIILMHPTLNTKEALEPIILEIAKRGLEIKTIEKMLNS